MSLVTAAAAKAGILEQAVSLALCRRAAIIRRHGLACQPRNLGQFADAHGARNNPGHRQHRLHFHPGRKIAGGSTGQGAPGWSEPGALHPRPAALRPRLDGQTHTPAVSYPNPRLAPGAAPGFRTRSDPPRRWVIFALEEHPG